MPTHIENRYLDPQALSELKNMELRARLIVEGFITGLHKSPYHGFSVEVAEHRPYNPGDEYKRIDWKVFGKTDRYYLKQYEEETNLRSFIVLDTSRSMRYRHHGKLTKLQYASYLAAALQYLMLKQRDATGLIAFDSRVHTVMPPKSTRAFLRTALAKLEELNSDPEQVEGRASTSGTAAAAALHEVAERISRRSLVIIMTDLFENVSEHDDLLRALKHLRHKKHEVLVFHILESHTERSFDFPDVPMLFRDMETGVQLSIHPGQIRRQYREAVEAFSNRFRRSCLEFNIDFEELDTGVPFERALLGYLNKRSRLT
jgi:uncharacterized protein (DUF58 family)